MIASMTGFARRESSGAWGTLICELRSVNHRFLESGFRLPEELRGLEPDLRQALMRELKRGKVDCTVTFRAAQGAQRALELDPEALQVLAARLRVVKAALSEHAGTVDALEVLRWPGVIRDVESGAEELFPTARTLVAQTLSDLTAAPPREAGRRRRYEGTHRAAARAGAGHRMMFLNIAGAELEQSPFADYLPGRRWGLSL